MRRLFDYIRSKGLDRETGRYLIVGILTTILSFGLFALLHEVIEIDANVSNVASVSVSVMFAYVTNKLIVFKRHCDTKGELAKEFIKFVGSRLFTIALEIGAVWLFVESLAYNALICKAVILVVVVILNYIISKLIVFRNLQ